MLQCWKAKPLLRPSFTELVESLGDLLDEGVKRVCPSKIFKLDLIIDNYINIIINLALHGIEFSVRTNG